MAQMIQTALTTLLGIRHPIIQAGMTAGTSAELAAAVSNAGALGSISASLRSAAQMEAEVARAQSLTDGPLAVNFVISLLNPDAFAAALSRRPAVVVLAVGCSDELVQQAKASGAKVFAQVNTVAQARQVVEQGVDAVVAQGAEAGGFTGGVGTMALVPQVVAAVAPVPVVAAGGVFDGRGLAAALSFGAAGVNVGTRFLAAAESPILPVWQQGILDAVSEDARTRDFLSVLSPPSPIGFPVSPRTLQSDFITEWQERAAAPGFQPDEMVQQVMSLALEGRMGEVVPFAGQSAGALTSIRPVAEIIESIMSEAEAAARRAAALFEGGTA
jgi:nitronate monooxygenase/enoyl-[acyl-carrier protein] reductase II